MAQYRLYCLADDGRFTKAEEITAMNGEDALTQARAMKIPARCELWNRHRKVAVVEPHLA